MVISNRAIPRVAAAGLVLGGCSDSDPTPASIAHEACNAIMECGYEFPYTSVAQCEQQLEEYFATFSDYLADSYGDACADAALDYYDCYFSEVRDACDLSVADARCDDLYERAYDLCIR